MVLVSAYCEDGVLRAVNIIALKAYSPKLTAAQGEPVWGQAELDYFCFIRTDLKHRQRHQVKIVRPGQGASLPPLVVKTHHMTKKLSGDLYRFELQFKEPAITSRGTYLTHTVWYPVLRFNGMTAIGECAPLPDLSADFLCMGETHEQRLQSYEQQLVAFMVNAFEAVRLNSEMDWRELRDYPSMRFGLETLMTHWASLRQEGITDPVLAARRMLWDSDFARGQKGIDINGLIWMGDFEKMARRIESKVQDGYRCIKLKIGAIDFNQELELLAGMRRRFSRSQLELRVDANGAFSPEEAMDKLKALSQFELHSIEQPVKAGQYEVMVRLCQDSPIPVGLDEELIGVNDLNRKVRLLDTVRPQYLILKPSLHGGIAGCKEWIELAQSRGIGYWVTSALESNIGLNALAQWCAGLDLSLPQGLGTGLLYTNNVRSPLFIAKAQLHCDLSRLGDDYPQYLESFLQEQTVNVAHFD